MGDDTKFREFERDLESLIERHSDGLDEDSISELLERARRQMQGEEAQLGARDSEGIVDLSESTEGYDDSPTVEARVDDLLDGYQPKSNAASPGRERVEAGHFPAQSAPRVDRWALDETSLDKVLLDLSSRTGIGALELRARRHSARLLIETGRVHRIELIPSMAKRSLLALMQRGGKLDENQVRRVRKYARAHGLSSAQALLQMPQVLPPDVVRSGVRSRVRYLLRRLLDANLASAEFRTRQTLPADTVPAGVPLVESLFAHTRAAHTGKQSGRRGRAEASFRGKQLARKTSFAFSVNQLGLDFHERQLVDNILEEARSFEQVLQRSPLPSADTVALLAGLEAVGLLDARPIGLSSPESSSWTQERDEALTRVALMEARLERESYFSIFGAHWATYDAEVERRFSTLHSRFKTLEQPLGLSSGDRRRITAVRERIEAIYRVLEDPAQRRRYRNTLVPASRRRRAARKLEQLGGAALRRGAFASALDYFQRLLELEPDHDKVSRVLPILIAKTSRR